MIKGLNLQNHSVGRMVYHLMMYERIMNVIEGMNVVYTLGRTSGCALRHINNLHAVNYIHEPLITVFIRLIEPIRVCDGA